MTVCQSTALSWPSTIADLAIVMEHFHTALSPVCHRSGPRADWGSIGRPRPRHRLLRSPQRLLGMLRNPMGSRLLICQVPQSAKPLLICKVTGCSGWQAALPCTRRCAL